MPEATFLQIQGRTDSPIRVIELPIGPIRIGKGPLCEVRLADPDIGEVQCMLRRRGSTWHFQPVGPPGRIWIDGRPADAQRALPFGVPLRVGHHWLTLRAADQAAGAWGSFTQPIAVEPRAVEVTPTAQEPPRPVPTEPDRPGTQAPEESDERLRRWQSRLDQRERWLKDRQDEKRWEARWKAAGESIRNRSAEPSKAPVTPPRSTPSTTQPRPSTAPMPGRPVEPRPAPGFKRPEHVSRPVPPRAPLRPGPSPAPPAKPPAIAPIATKPRAGSPSRALVALPPPSIDPPALPVGAPPLPDRAPSPMPPAPAAEEARAPTVPEVPAIEVPEARSPIEVAEGVFEIEEIVEDLPIPEARPDPEETFGRVSEVLEADLDEFSTRSGRSSPASSAEPLPFDPSPEELPEGEARGAESERAPESSRTATARSEWPSARTIFAAQAARPAVEEPGPARASRRRTVGPTPSEVLAPASWSIPSWLGCLTALAMATVVGSAGIALAFEWTLDGQAANLALKLALRDEKSSAPSVDPALVPRGGWWTSTAPHRSAWAVALSRASEAEDHSEEIRAMVEAARYASPLSSATRFAIEPVAPPSDESAVEFRHLGRPRDLVSLTWTGRRLRRDGKPEAALRAYRTALSMAGRAGREVLPDPGFDDENQVRRYRLPREALMGSVLLDMIRAGEWTHEQWVEGLPETVAAPLFASKALLKAKNRAEADRMADLAIDRAESEWPAGTDPAEQRAAAAEALAGRGRWADSAAQYRLAIQASDDDPTRRRWWLNLAEVARRMNDDSVRAQAIESAKAPDSLDEITRRALRQQQGGPGLAARGERP